MLDGLSGKGLFVFSDPGGAKAILAYVQINQIEEFLIVSDRSYSFFEDFGLEVKECSAEEVITIFNEFKPDYLFTGTSYTSKIELDFINESNNQGIRSIAFIDHYTRFKDRFESDGKEIYPSEIALIDQKALRLARECGLDSYSNLLVTGNFYHNFLNHWKPNTSRDELYDKLDLDYSKKLVVYAPEPLSNVDNAGQVFGFDEVETTAGLLSALDSELDKLNFVLTLHPNQNLALLEPTITDNIVLNQNRAKVNELIHYADVVIGMFSNFLIEAEAMGKPVLRYFCKPVNNDPLRGTNIGKVVDDLELLSEIKSL